MNNAQHNSASAEHGTPNPIILSSYVVMGDVDLDPASSAIFNKTVRANKYYNARSNGFTKKWAGNVLLNPPGGFCDGIGKRVNKVKDVGYVYENGKKAKTHYSASSWWWFRLARAWQEEDVEAIFIGFSIEVMQRAQMYKKKYFPHLTLPSEFPYCIPEDRLSFSALVGKKLTPGKSNTHASVLVYLPPKSLVGPALRKQKKVFAKEFAQHGAVVIP